jgi:isoleucyl-tRNA synthetase
VLLALLASITTFTCDEAMAYMLNDSDFGESYIQLMDWPNSSTMEDFSNEEREVDIRLSFKTKVNERLEQARQSKLIEQSLDAKAIIEISTEDKIFSLLRKYLEILPEIFIVSEIEIKEITAGRQFSVEITTVSGEKCPRSSKWVDNFVDAGPFDRASQK